MLLCKQIAGCVALLLVAGLLGSPPAHADTIAVIGTGNVAGALGPEFAAQGHTIVYGSRDPSRDVVRALVDRTGNAASATTPAESVVGADIVVMAVPGTAVEAVTKGLGDLSGKIIIDPTNAIDRSNDGYLELVYDTSSAEIIQGAAPGAYVVKALRRKGVQYAQLADHGRSGLLRWPGQHSASRRQCPGQSDGGGIG
jgi:predicted dinucleotide-binding enzyme